MSQYRRSNKPVTEYTASPNKYPQGHFKPKPCRRCGNMFDPVAPSHFYCSQECADEAFTEAYLKRTYGITYDDYQRMLEDQGYVCAICGEEGFVMKSTHKLKLVVDHCHTTGRVRGLLCHNCNRALGLLKDAPERLLKAVEYLKV